MEGWFADGGAGCEVPADPALAERVFRDPTGCYLQFEVLEQQGTGGPTGPFRGRLQSR